MTGTQRAIQVFDAAANLPPADRAAYLDAACGSNAALRDEVESLLAHDGPWPGLDRPALGASFHVGRLDDAGPEGPAASALPERLGQYRILGVIGVGGMGVVYRAEQEHAQRIVALKTIRGAPTGDARRRFRVETASLSRLAHPGIGRIYDAGADGDVAFIAMELIEGLPLVQFAVTRKLNLRARLTLFAQVCDALAYAHRRGVIHRDLKPANILVVAEESSGFRVQGSGESERLDSGLNPEPRTLSPQPKILDFGVARLIDADPAMLTRTMEADRLVGTLAYMSPEQLANEEIDTRTDVYSLGVLLYELLTDRLPFPARDTSLVAALRARQCATSPPPSRHVPQLRGDVDTIVLHALAHEREQRYASADALAADIRRFLANEPIAARPAGRVYLFRKFAARNRVFVASAMLLLVSLTLGIVGTSYWALRAQHIASELDSRLVAQAESATFVVEEVVRNLDKMAGTAAIRRELTEHALRETEALLARDPQSVRLRDVYAHALTHFADLERESGAVDQRREFCGRALAIRERLAAEHPDDPELMAEWALSLVRVGDCAGDVGDLATTGDHYRRAYAIQERLGNAAAAAARHVDDLVWAQIRMADLNSREGRHDDAAAFARAALETHARLAERFPQRVENRHALEGVYTVQASLADRDGRPEAARAHHRARLEVLRALVAEHPNDRRFLPLLAHALACVGGADLDAGDFATAKRRFAEGLDAARRLRLLDPTDAGYARLVDSLEHAAAEAAQPAQRPK